MYNWVKPQNISHSYSPPSIQSWYCIPTIFSSIKPIAFIFSTLHYNAYIVKNKNGVLLLYIHLFCKICIFLVLLLWHCLLLICNTFFFLIFLFLINNNYSYGKSVDYAKVFYVDLDKLFSITIKHIYIKFFLYLIHYLSYK